MPNRFRSRIRIWSESQVVRFSPQLRDLINRLKLCVLSSPIAHVPHCSLQPLPAREAIGREQQLMLVLVRHGKQMGVKRDPVPCPHRMFTVGENLHPRKMGSEEFVEARAGEKIFVIALKHMPGHSFPVLKIGNDFDVGHREQRPPANDSRDFS